MKSRACQERTAKEVKAAATRQNPIRFRMALPADVDLDDIAWKPTQLENRWARLARIDAKFAVTEREYRELRIQILQRMIDQDLAAIKKLS